MTPNETLLRFIRQIFKGFTFCFWDEEGREDSREGKEGEDFEAEERTISFIQASRKDNEVVERVRERKTHMWPTN